MALCIVGAGVTRFAIAAFTLSWTHSVQHTRWQEDWLVTPAGLSIAEARIESSGAGMEAPEGATFDGTWWRWKPKLGVLPRVSLRNSGATADWSFCTTAGCRPLAEIAPADPITLEPCD